MLVCVRLHVSVIVCTCVWVTQYDLLHSAIPHITSRGGGGGGGGGGGVVTEEEVVGW